MPNPLPMIMMSYSILQKFAVKDRQTFKISLLINNKFEKNSTKKPDKLPGLLIIA